MRKVKWVHITCLLGTIACIQGIVLKFVAMGFYAGGSSENPSTPGFSFWENVLSDLGMLTAHSGRQNLVSAALFGSSLFIAGALLIPFFIAFPSLFSRARGAKKYAIAGGILGILMASAFIGGSVTPADIFYDIHVKFGALSFLTALPVTITLAAAIFLDFPYPKRFAWTYVALGIIIAIVLIALVLSSGTGTTTIVLAVGQKIMVFSILGCFMYQTYGARKRVQKHRKK